MTNSDEIVETTTEKLGNSVIVRKDRLYYIEDDPRWPFEEGYYYGYSLYGRKPLPDTIQIKVTGEPSQKVWLNCKNDIYINNPDEIGHADLSPMPEFYDIKINTAPVTCKDAESYWIKKAVPDKAIEVTKGCKSIEDKIRKILKFVARIPRKETDGYIDTVKDPFDTLQSNNAHDCKDYSELMFQMCRSLGIPIRKISGIFDTGGKDNIDEKFHCILVDDRYIGHRWVTYHDGAGWLDLDPTNNQLPKGFDSENNYKGIITLRTFSTDTTCEFVL